MALFQEQAIENIETEKQNKIYQDYKNEFDELYSKNQKIVQQRKENESLWVSNLISPEKINEWKNKGSMTAIEVWHKKNKNELIPYMGTWKEGTETFKLKKISDKIAQGQFVTPEEKEAYNNFILDMAEIQTRGYSFGGGAMNISLETIPFMAEFATGLLTTGGIQSLGSSLAKIGAKTTVKNLAKKTGKEILGDIAKGTIKTVYNSTVNPRTLAFTTTRLPQQVRARMGDIMLSDSVAITPEGQVILKESETKPATAFFKALALTNIEVGSEMSGDILVRPFMHGMERIIAPKVLRNLASKNLPEKFVKLAEKTTNMPFLRAVDTLGFNGVLEEIGEERVGDLLKTSFNLDDKEGYSFEQFLDAAFPSVENLGQEALSFALTGVGMNAINSGLKKVSTNYSKDGFLIDSGIFRTPNQDSLLDSKTREILKQQGASEEDIEDVLQYSTHGDKIEFLKNGNFNQQAIDERKKLTNIIKNKFFTQNLNAGVDEETALATATVESEAIASLAKNINMSADDVHKAFNITLQSMTDEEANEQFEKDNEELKKQIFRQSVEDKNTVDLSNDFEKAPTLEEVKNYINQIIENGTKFATLSPDWFVDIKKEKSNRKQKRISDKILNNGNFLKLNRKEKDRHNKYILSLERLLNNSEYIGEKENKKKDKKPYVAKYHYFKTNVKIGNKTYQIIFDTEEYNNPQSATTSIPVVSKEHSTDSKLPTAQYVNRILKPLSEDTNSITNSDSNFNPKTVHLYNITELKPSKIHYQNIEETPKNNIEKTFGDTVENITENIKNDVMNILAENNVDESEFDFEDIQIYGSYAKGTNKATSDLDIIVQYSGSMPEDGAFNMFAEEDLSIEDLNGNNVKIDINPINSAKSGTIEENLKYFDSIDDRIHFQSMNNKNNVVDWTDKFDKVPTFAEIEKHIKEIIASGEIFDTLSPEWKIDIKGGNRVVDKITNNGNFQKLQNSGVKRHNKYVSGIKELINNSVHSHSDKNNKPKEKPNIANYHYFDVNVKIGDKSYWVRLECEETKNAQQGRYAQRSRQSHQSNNNLKQNDKNVKIVHLYNIKEMKANKVYFQGEDNIENARGFTYERKNFDGTIKDNLIVLLKGKANVSTLLHEFAHVYLTTLNNLARENDKAKDLLIKVNKYLRYNGKEYTTYQHEKFANTFVAYVKTGKAPSYGLKKVFENFKKWLNDLYSSLQLTDDFELSQEAKDLFDELLGDMTLDAQKEASLDIIRKAKNNALLKLQQEEADKQKIPLNQLTDKQKRYRDTAYDILWYALSHTKNKEGKQLVKDKRQLYMLLANENKMNKKNKGITLQAEKLEQALAELDDPFSAHDGFLPEWGEFFNDPGVSYDNREVGADSTLALMALDVIKNKKYLYDFENGYEELSNKDVRVAELELEYILQVYKENETDKSNVVIAFFEWIDNQHPYIQEEFIKQWELKTNEIDRYLSLSKFAQAKEDLKLYAATLKGRGDYSWQFAEYARAILKRLDFMTERDKERIFDKLKEYNSFREVERNLDFVMDYAETLSDVTDRRKLADDIVSEVKQTIHGWKGGIKKTKYTYPANKLFERLRKINNMKQEEIENLYDEQVKEETQPSYVSDEVNDKDFYETIEKMFITFKYNGLYHNSTEFLTDLLNKIQSAKFTAKVARDELDFERRLQQINLIDECARAIDKHRQYDKDTKIKEIAQNINAHIMNLNGALEMIFNNKIKNQFSLDYLYAKKDGQVGKDRREVLDKLKNIFQFKNDRQLFSKIIDMTKPEYVIKQRFTPDIENGSFHTSDIYDKESGQTKATVQQILPEGLNRNEWEPEKIKLSKMEIIYYYIQSKNNISYKMLTDMGDETTSPKGQFDKFEFDQMIDSLTMQEKLMGDVLQAAAEKYYDGLNAYHIKRYHTDLGKVSCYFPRLSEVEDPKMLDVFNDYVMYNGKDSSQKHRTAYVGTRIKPANALAVLFSHIEKANTIIIMGEQLDLMNRVFNNSNLKKKIETAFGQDITQAFYQHITANLYSGQSALRSLQEQFFAKIANNAVKTQIFFKPQIGLKQLLSFMNYGKGDEYVSAGEWLKEFTKQTLTPSEWKKNIDFMLENDYLRDRYSRGGSTDALKRQLENRMFSKLSLLDELWGLPIQLGDIGAIIWGGKPYVDVLMKKGYTKEQAFKIFIETTVNDQQSSIPSTLSNAQRKAKKNAFSTMMFAYQNTPYQYLRSCYTPIVKALQEGGSKNISKAAKMFFIYGWLFPAIFNMASTLSVFSLLGGDDDQFKKDMQFAFLGLFGMLPIWGDTLKAIIYGLAGDNYSGGTNYFVTASNKLNKLARHIEKEKVTLADVWNAIAVIGEMSTGQPLGSMGNAVSGIYDVTQGNTAKGALKVMGYSDYRAKTVTGEK